MAATAPTPLIAWSHLAQILVYSLVAGVGIVALICGGIVALSYARRDSSSLAARWSGWITSVVCTLAAFAAIGWGLYLISHKS